MTVARLFLMDRSTLTRDDVPVRLEPRFMAVLARLALSLGESVPVDELSAQVLSPQAASAAYRSTKDDSRRRRVHVYKCISAIRAALDPEQSGDASTLVLLDSGANPGYRLVMQPDDVDLVRFERLVAASRSASPLRAITQLREALSLWRGRPLADLAHHAWARERIELLLTARDEARRRLFEHYADAEQYHLAAEIGAAIAAEHPEDVDLRRRLAELPSRGGTRNVLLRHDTGYWGNVISVRTGDLFEHRDAHLVIGFSDTFETNPADDVLVSRTSLQGQLVERLYGGDHRALDRDLRAALRDAPRKVESRAVKRYGKLSRFPIGTVAVLSQDDRRIFAVGYSKVGRDGRYTRSSPARLRSSLDRLWRAVLTHGQRRPVALGIVGAGLARIDELDRVDLVELTVRSFLRHQSRARVADELRIIVHPKDYVDLDPDRLDARIAEAVADAHRESPPRERVRP